MTTRVKLNRFKLNRRRKTKLNGVELDVFLSPYDVPEEVDGEYDEERNRFVIRFKYLAGEEPLARQTYDNHITLGIGRSSSRLYEIEIDVDAMEAESIELQLLVPRIVEEVDEAIDKLTAMSGRPRRDGNYDIAKEVVSEKRNELFAALGAP